MRNELFYIFVRKIKFIIYQDTKKDYTVDRRHYTGGIYRRYCLVEYTQYSTGIGYISCQRISHDFKYTHRNR